MNSLALAYGAPQYSATATVIHASEIKHPASTARRVDLDWRVGSRRGALAGCWLPHQVEPVAVLAPYGHRQLLIRSHLSWAAALWSFHKVISPLCSVRVHPCSVARAGPEPIYSGLPCPVGGWSAIPACCWGFCLLAHNDNRCGRSNVHLNLRFTVPTYFPSENLL